MKQVLAECNFLCIKFEALMYRSNIYFTFLMFPFMPNDVYFNQPTHSNSATKVQDQP